MVRPCYQDLLKVTRVFGDNYWWQLLMTNFVNKIVSNESVRQTRSPLSYHNSLFWCFVSINSTKTFLVGSSCTGCLNCCLYGCSSFSCRTIWCFICTFNVINYGFHFRLTFNFFNYGPEYRIFYDPKFFAENATENVTENFWIIKIILLFRDKSLRLTKICKLWIRVIFAEV